jgi:Fe-S-cluster containining protein
VSSHPTSENEALKQAIIQEYPRLGLDSRFRFRCHPGIDCYNVCCGDVNVVLTPYDVLRLRRRLKLGSREFLDKFTILPFTGDQKLPVVLLRMVDNENKACPFVGASGCSVYEDRPWPCRMYPMGIASSKTEARPDGEEFYFVLSEEHCHGGREAQEWSVAQWLESQQVADYDAMGSAFKEVTLHPRLVNGPSLEPRKMDMFFMACYDTDQFRRFLFESHFFDKFVVFPERVEKLKTDDEELLRFGFEWLRFALFGDATMTVRDDVLDAKRREVQGAQNAERRTT